jgi:hypothetical protein
VVSHGRYVTFQMAEVTVSRQMFAGMLSLVARLRVPPTPALRALGTQHGVDQRDRHPLVQAKVARFSDGPP